MSMGDLTTNHYVFQDEKGKTITLEGGSWEWGSYYDFTYVDVNVIEFAEYISQLEIKDLEGEFPEILSNYGYYRRKINMIDLYFYFLKQNSVAIQITVDNNRYHCKNGSSQTKRQL